MADMQIQGSLKHHELAPELANAMEYEIVEVMHFTLLMMPRVHLAVDDCIFIVQATRFARVDGGIS